MNVTREQVIENMTEQPETAEEIAARLASRGQPTGRLHLILRRLWRCRKVEIDFLARPRRFWLASLLVLLACVAGAAPPVRLEWDPSPDDIVTGYRIRLNSDVVDVTGTHYTATNLVAGREYRISVVAVSGDGIESEPSNELILKVPGFPITIEVSHDLRVWQTLTAVEVPVETPAAFYRLAVRQEAPAVIAEASLRPASVVPVKAPFGGSRMVRRTAPPPPTP